MTMTTFREKRRARRIASDEAHSWARNLRLGNIHAKLVLCMLSLYVNGDGICWVSAQALAEDCELSDDTVRRRLAWLAEIGAIARWPQWIDEYGRRNGDRRGKRTTDMIQLLYDADIDEIEARAAGKAAAESPAVSTEISLRQQRRLNEGQDPASARLASGQPPHCSGVLISEPEPEQESPPTPSGGESEPDAVFEEPEDFGPAWLSWPGHEVMRRDLALAEFRLLSLEKQRLCRWAIPRFVKRQGEIGRKHPPNFHLWIRSRGFEEFPDAKPHDQSAAPAGGPIELASDSARAVHTVYAIARTRPFISNGRMIYPKPITPQLLAFAQAPPQSEWVWIEDRQQTAAWSSFLGAHVTGARPQLVTTRGAGADARKGFLAPWPWPPRKDGTISNAGEAA
jgi:Helix-turn-helix domain